MGAQVEVQADGASNPPTTTTSAEGMFTFSRREIEPFAAGGQFTFMAQQNGRSGSGSVCVSNLFFEPVHFRSVKYKIYEAALLSPDGSGFSVQANADAHFRAALAPGGVIAHLLWRCPLGQAPLKARDRLNGQFILQLRPSRR